MSDKVINFNARLEKKKKGMTREQAIELCMHMYELSDDLFYGLTKLTDYIEEDIGHDEFVGTKKLVNAKQYILANGIQLNTVLNNISEFIKYYKKEK